MMRELSRLGHEQVQLFHPKLDLSPMVDVKIAPLIDVCWKLNILTYQSCWLFTENQESWIKFDSKNDIIKFLSLTIKILDNVKIKGGTRPEILFYHLDIEKITEALSGALKASVI